MQAFPRFTFEEFVIVPNDLFSISYLNFKYVYQVYLHPNNHAIQFKRLSLISISCVWQVVDINLVWDHVAPLEHSHVRTACTPDLSRKGFAFQATEYS